MKTLALPFVEKEFYLDEFHDKSLLLIGRAAELTTDEEVEELGEVCRVLLTNETRVLILLENTGAKEEQRRIAGLQKVVTRGRGASLLMPLPIHLSATAPEDELLGQIWSVLRASPSFLGAWPAQSEQSLLTCARQVATRLKVYKVVVLDAGGGIWIGGGRISFMNGPVLSELLRQGEAEWAGLGARRPLLEVLRAMLEGGVASISLCPARGLARELFTYEGYGTLFTLADYCRVERLGIDDFHEVEKLLERGEREGFLKVRTASEIGQLLLHGYGARLGTAEGEMAGFCALLPYPEENAAEIVGLYTITRFQGEGIGSRLVTLMINEGEAQGLRYLFAITAQDGAQRLFERHGFRRVTPEDVAEAKWRSYDLERKKQVAVYRRELPPPERGLGL
ncbi:MAG: GNAT family N-acetyltransferase [Deltaproteobacteria bacterium]|nr:GNAT family N-acetyltransferase [Deltaproteobacteria bacterium]